MDSVETSASEQHDLSPLLRKAVGLGLNLTDDLVNLAIVRGARYYDGRCETGSLREESRLQIGQAEFPNAELAIALLSPRLPAGSGAQRLHHYRVGSAVLSARGVDPNQLCEFAEEEGCAPLLRWIAVCGNDVEPDEPFWKTLLDRLPESEKPPGAPHPTRLMEMTGITAEGRGIKKRWLRTDPVAEDATVTEVYDF